jgi:hypothetical protein
MMHGPSLVGRSAMTRLPAEIGIFLSLLYDWPRLEVGIRHERCGRFALTNDTSATCKCLVSGGAVRYAQECSIVAVWT